jgi:predicted amidophosphoribosyltransferase
MSGRIAREKKTVKAMIEIYCKKHHHNDLNDHQKSGLCPNCQELFNYANKRLDKCKYQVQKPTCANCEIHCYKEPERTQMKNIMRFSGPRMLFRHPILAIQHLLDK